MVAPRGFEPHVSALKGPRPSPTRRRSHILFSFAIVYFIVVFCRIATYLISKTSASCAPLVRVGGSWKSKSVYKTTTYLNSRHYWLRNWESNPDFGLMRTASFLYYIPRYNQGTLKLFYSQNRCIKYSCCVCLIWSNMYDLNVASTSQMSRATITPHTRWYFISNLTTIPLYIFLRENSWKRKERGSRLPTAHFLRFTTLDLLCKSVVSTTTVPMLLLSTPRCSRWRLLPSPLIYIPRLDFRRCTFCW